MRTKLTVPIAAKNLKQAKRQIKAAKAVNAEAIELRTDYLEDLSVPGVKKMLAEAINVCEPLLPIIVTCRDIRQGGAKDWPEELRIDVLCTAVRAGADFIDLEFENYAPAENQQKIKQALAENPQAKLILSAHNFEGKFENIGQLHQRIISAEPTAIPKLIYTANHINDCFEAFDLLHNANSDAIVFCMGEAGLISRIVAKKLGSFVTFAGIDEKTTTAPGQLTAEQLKTLYRFDGINAETELYGVIGSPVAHSAGPAIHNACFAHNGMNKLYLPLLIEGGKNEFNEFMQNVIRRKWLGFRGFSVTIPHKANALAYVKENGGFVEPRAEKIGAANTLLIDENGMPSAYNTDYAGALDAITSALGVSRGDLKGWDVTVVGAGGVARAIVAGLTDIGARVKIYNRTVKKAERLAAEFDCSFAGLDDLPNIDAKLLINCTSVGMHPDVNASAIPKECLKKDMAVFDTVYNPAETLLLKQAKQVGAKTIDGLTMFINQAAYQFKLFTDEDADRKLMRKTICE